MTKKSLAENELVTLKNVGPATLKDLAILEIYSIEELAKQDPYELYDRIQRLTGQRQIFVYGMYLLLLFMKQKRVRKHRGGIGQKFVKHVLNNINTTL